MRNSPSKGSAMYADKQSENSSMRARPFVSQSLSARSNSREPSQVQRTSVNWGRCFANSAVMSAAAVGPALAGTPPQDKRILVMCLTNTYAASSTLDRSLFAELGNIKSRGSCSGIPTCLPPSPAPHRRSLRPRFAAIFPPSTPSGNPLGDRKLPRKGRSFISSIP